MLRVKEKEEELVFLIHILPKLGKQKEKSSLEQLITKIWSIYND